MHALKQDILDKYRDSYELQAKSIQDLTPYIPLLAKFNKLKYVTNPLPQYLPSLITAQLSLKANLIESVPASIKALSSIQQLDLSDNPISDTKGCLNSLKQLPNLRVLYLDADTTDEAVRNTLTRLEFFNGRKLRDKPQPLPILSDLARILIDSDYLLQISNIFDNINHVCFRQKRLPQQVGSFKENFEIIFSELYLKLKHTNNPYLKAMLTVDAKYSLQKFCSNKIYQSLGIPISSSNLYQSLVPILHKLNEMDDGCHGQLMNIIQAQSKDKVDTQMTLKAEEISRLMSENTHLKSEVFELEQRVKELQQDNRTYLQKLIDYSKGGLQNVSSLNHFVGYKSLKQISYAKPFPVDELSSTYTKKLPPYKMEELITEIYENKYKSEQYSLIPMSQYIPLFFTHKLGTDLAEEAVRVFRDSLADLAETESNNVIVFTKILHGECEEGYMEERERLLAGFRRCATRQLVDVGHIDKYEVGRIFKSKIFDFNPNLDMMVEMGHIYAILRQGYSEQEIDFMLKKLQPMTTPSLKNYTSSLENSGVMDLKLYSPTKQSFEFSHMASTVSLVSFKNSKSKSLLHAHNNTSSPSKPVAALTLKVSLKRFMNVYLNFQLQKHLLKIEKLTAAFKSIDDDNDTYLTVEQVEQALQLAGVQGPRNDQLRSLLQPWLWLDKKSQKAQLSYSKFVEIFSRRMKPKLKPLAQSKFF